MSKQDGTPPSIMLQYVGEQKMSLATYGSDGSIPALTSAQLDIRSQQGYKCFITSRGNCPNHFRRQGLYICDYTNDQSIKKTLEESGEDRGICDCLSKNPTCLHNFNFLFSQHYLQCPRNGSPKFHPSVACSFGIIVIDNRKSKIIDLYSDHTENKLQALTFAAISSVWISLQHCNLA